MMVFLIRAAFWLTLVGLLLPVDKRSGEDAVALGSAAARGTLTVEDLRPAWRGPESPPGG